MSKPRYVRELTADEEDELERMMQQEVGRVAQRAHMILLSSRDYTVQQIEAIHQVTNITVYKWLDRFEANGPAGLYDEEREGRPPKLDAEARQFLADTVEQSPTDLGYNFTRWTLPLLTSHLKQELGVDVSTETVRKALEDLGYCWSRPRRVAPAADKQQQQAVQDEIDARLDEADASETFVYIDETTVKRLPVLRGMWMRCGHQRHVPALATNTDFVLYGALNPLTGDTFHARFDRGISEHTTIFLQQIVDAHCDTSITVIWDRASIHTSRHVEQWLDDHPHVDVILLPPRSPQMNPVEDIWRHLKNQVAANLTRTLDALAQACHRFFNQHTSDALKRLAGLNHAA
jgi:transposase